MLHCMRPALILQEDVTWDLESTAGLKVGEDGTRHLLPCTQASIMD